MPGGGRGLPLPMGNSGVPSLLLWAAASFSRCWFRARTPHPQLFAAAVAELRLIDCRFSADDASDLIESRVLVRVGSSSRTRFFESALLVVGASNVEDSLFVGNDDDSERWRR